MRYYLIKRLGSGVIVILITVSAVFALVRLSGDPANALLPNYASAEDYDEVHRQFGLDKSIYVQYGIYLKNLVTFNFGKCAKTRLPIKGIILERLPNTVYLAATSMVLILVMAIPMGVIAAIYRDRYCDWVVRIIAAFGQSMPIFWFALVLIRIVSIKFNLLPVGGMTGIRSYILPSFCEALFAIAGVSRLLRSSMIEILDSEFIKTARAKGVSEIVVIWKHAFKNSLIPVITYSGMYFALILMGAVVIETIFAWPGIGRLLWESVLNRDYNLVQSLVAIMVATVILCNITVDIIYFYIDPRIRISENK